MQEPQSYLNVYRALVSLLINDLNYWERPYSIALTDKDTQNALTNATQLRWGRIKRALARLETEGLISIEPGTGRGNRTVIRFNLSPKEIIQDFEGSVSSNQATPDSIDTIRRDMSREGIGNSERPLEWWEGDRLEEPNQILQVPGSDAAFIDDELIGRDNYIAELTRLLRHQQVIAVVGQPGIGKTHLIARFIHKLLDVKGGLGIFWVNLSEKSTLDEFSGDFLIRTGGKSLEPSDTSLLLNKADPPSAQAYAMLAALRQRRLLLVIDNLENVLDNETLSPHDEGFRVFLQLLLEHSLGESRVLFISHWVPKDVRSREPPALEIEGLKIDEGVRFMQYLGVNLPRTKAERLLAEVGGNPLAIQILRTRLIMGILPSMDILGPAAVAVQDVFKRLTRTELIILGAVGILIEDASEGTVRSILSARLGTRPQQLSPIIDDLVNSKRLLKYSWSNERGVRVFGLHPLIRSYVVDHALSKEDIVDLHRAALNYQIERSDPTDKLDPSRLYATRHALAAEAYNIAADILFKKGFAKALLSASRLGQLRLILEELLLEGSNSSIENLQSLLQTASKRGIEEYLEEALRFLGLVCWRQGRLAEAEGLFQKINSQAFKQNGHNMAALAGVRLDQGHHRDGLTIAHEAHDLAKMTSDSYAEMEAWGWIGYALDEIGPVDKCIDAYERAIEISQKLSDVATESITEARLGMIYWKTGQADTAGPHFMRATDLATIIGDPYYMGLALGDLGHYYMDKSNRSEEDLTKAIDCYTRALEIHRAAGVRRGEGFWNGQLGRCHLQLGHLRIARKYLKEAIDIHLEVGDRTAIPRHLYYFAQLHGTSASRIPRHRVLSLAYYQLAITLFREIESNVEGDRVEIDFKKVQQSIPEKDRDWLIKAAGSHIPDILKYLTREGGYLP
jgi:tetratricopeptide (TPR) repeat protein